jgi:hypothetical protein
MTRGRGLSLTALLVRFEGFLHQVVAQGLELSVHADPEGVGEPQFPADVVDQGHAQATVRPDVDVHVRPDGWESSHQVTQVLVDAEAQ